MKYIITEDQLKIFKDKILKVSFYALDNDWKLLQEFLNRRGNPPYIITDNVSLSGNEEIKTLGSLISVEGHLNLSYSSIQSIGSLTEVKGDLNLTRTPIQSLGNLTSVGGYLYLLHTPVSKKYSRQEIRDMVKVRENIFL
jgi:hypothetical protein